MELWKDIPSYEGLYQASTMGRIRSLYTNKILKHEISKNGYCKVTLCKNRVRKLCSVHRLVATTFLPNHNKKLQVNHKDGNKTNNCVDNLEWATSKENIIHSYKNKLQIPKKGKEHPLYRKYGKENKTSKKINQYDLQGNFIKTWDSIMDVERILNINNGNISSCCNGKKRMAGGFIWRHCEISQK